jgi:hypothetical protein
MSEKKINVYISPLIVSKVAATPNFRSPAITGQFPFLLIFFLDNIFFTHFKKLVDSNSFYKISNIYLYLNVTITEAARKAKTRILYLPRHPKGIRGSKER